VEAGGRVVGARFCALVLIRLAMWEKCRAEKLPDQAAKLQAISEQV
jgi:hypothetical protein